MKRGGILDLRRVYLSRLIAVGAVLAITARLVTFEASAATGPLADSPAPTYGVNANRTARSPYSGPRTMPTVKWSFTRYNDHWGTDYRGTGIGLNNTVYLAAGMAGVYAIDSATGTRKWLYSPGNTGHETFVEFPPTVAADGRLYFTSENDFAYALDANGNQLWEFRADHLHTPISISPDGTRVHFTSENAFIYALDRETGAQIWRYQLAQFGVYATGRRIPIVYDSAGTLRWSLNLPQRGSNPDTVGPAVGEDGTLYFTRADAITAVGMNGQQKWEYVLGNTAFDRTPAIGADGTVYIGVSDGFVYALNPDGSLKWKQKYVNQTGWGAGVKSNILIDAQGTLFFYGRDGFVYGVDSQTRQVLWRYNSNQQNLSYPGVQLSLDADGTLYVPVDERMMLALAPAAGPPGTATATPTMTQTSTTAETNTPTATPTQTNTPTQTQTATPTRTPTQTATSTATSTQVSLPAGNLLTNPGFEADANGDNLPDSWTLSSGSASVISRSSAQEYEGDYSLRATGGSPIVFQDVPAAPGQVYNFAGRLNVPANTGSFRASIQLVALNMWNGSLSTVTVLSQTSATSGWVPATGSIALPNGTAKVRVQVKFEFVNSDVYVDGFSLTRTK